MAWMTSCVVMGVVWTLAVLMVSPVRAGAAEEPSPDNTACCSPDQWEGRQLVSYVQTGFGATYMVYTTMDVSYDAVNEQEVYNVTQSNNFGKSEKYVLYAFYKDNVAYRLNLKSGACTIQRLNGFTKRCIPATSKVLDPQVILGVGSNQLTAKRVYYELPSSGATTYGTALVTDQCVPIFETQQKSSYGVLKITSNTFEDIEAGIESEDVFELPDACKTQTKRSDDEPLDMSDFIRIPA